MSKTKSKNKIVYAIYPNANGFGFVYLDSPRNLLDYGVVKINPICNKLIMKRIRKSFEYLRPAIVIVQDPISKNSRTGKRVKRLVERIITYTKKEKLPLVQYSRDQIRGVFEQFGAITKYEISKLLLTEFRKLEWKAPKKRKLWTSEDRNMAIFDALSLAVTWFYLNT